MIFNTKIVIDMETGKELFRDLPHIYFGPVALADKNAKAKAGKAADTATSEGSRYGSEGSSISSTLVPELRREATSPTGFMPNDLNAMLVGGAEGAGGATGALSGEATLGAARSRNTGALSGVLDEIARSKTRALGSQALGVQSMNAEEKQRQRSEGLHGLESVYGTDVGAQLKEQGLVPEDINAMLKANESGWGKNLMDWTKTLTGAAGGASSLKTAFG
jgi:hypothetical protein